MNHRLALLCAAAVSLAAFGMASPASASCTLDLGSCGDVDATGFGCRLTSTTDPTADNGIETAQISGGPLLVQDHRGLPLSGTLHCYVQLDDGTPSGDGPGVSAHGTGVVVAGPGQISYEADHTVFLCSSFTDDRDGVTYYPDPTTGGFSPTGTACGPGVATSPEPGGGPEADLLDAALCPVLITADDALGTPLAATWGGCEGYAPII